MATCVDCLDWLGQTEIKELSKASQYFIQFKDKKKKIISKQIKGKVLRATHTSNVLYSDKFVHDIIASHSITEKSHYMI